MISANDFRNLALSFHNSSEAQHFELAAFKVNKKIFATLDESRNRACLMLSPIDQSIYCDLYKDKMYPVPNKWGLQGATFVDLMQIRKNEIAEALKCAYDLKLKPKIKTK